MCRGRFGLPLPAGSDRQSEGGEPAECVDSTTQPHARPPFHHSAQNFHLAPAARSSVAMVAAVIRRRRHGTDASFSFNTLTSCEGHDARRRGARASGGRSESAYAATGAVGGFARPVRSKRGRPNELGGVRTWVSAARAWPVESILGRREPFLHQRPNSIRGVVHQG